MFAEMVPLLQKDPGCAFAYCDVTRVRADGSRADDFGVAGARPVLSGDILPSLLAGGYFPPVSVVVRSSIIDRVGGFDPSLGGCCDWDLWIRIAANEYRAQFFDRRMAYYRLHDESMSRDLTHMKSTAVDTLAKNMAAFPGQMARSVGALIETSEAIFKSKATLIDQLDSLQKKIADDHDYTVELARGKEWLEEHWRSERDENVRLTQRIKELDDIRLMHEKHIGELEAGKNRREAQSNAHQEALPERAHSADDHEENTGAQ